MTEQQIRNRSLRSFKDPPTWPLWPYRAIIRLKPDGSMPDCVTLVDFGEFGGLSDVHIVDALLYDLAVSTRSAKTEEAIAAARATPPIDAEKMVAEGWVID